MKRSVRRRVGATLLAAAILAGAAGAAGVAGGAPPATAATPASKAHWGWYSWGSDSMPVRAFWLIDRTGNPTLHHAIAAWVYFWNDGRAKYLPSLPYVFLYVDDANAGACFHTGNPSYSLAMVCSGSPTGLAVETSVQLFPTSPPHIVSPFMRVNPALDFNTMLTVVCHGMGVMVGFGVSSNPTSCMRNVFPVGQLVWYDAGDVATAVELYNSHTN